MINYGLVSTRNQIQSVASFHSLLCDSCSTPIGINKTPDQINSGMSIEEFEIIGEGEFMHRIYRMKSLTCSSFNNLHHELDPFAAVNQSFQDIYKNAKTLTLIEKFKKSVIRKFLT
jgi:hypothetical protein